MKRKILSLLFIAIATITFTSIAQNENVSSSEINQEETCKCNKHKKGGFDNKKKHFNPFEGIALSESQKEQLKEIVVCHKKEKKQSFNDTNEGKKSPKEMRRKQLDDIKSILTPEQYIQYLENIAMSKSHKQFKHMHKKCHFNNSRHQQNN